MKPHLHAFLSLGDTLLGFILGVLAFTVTNVGDAFFGLALTAIGVVVAWVLRTSISTKERVLVLEGENKALQEKVRTMDKERVTVECVREVIEGALDKRDKAHEKRRAEWDKLRRLEIAEALQTEMGKVLPQLVRAVRGERGS